MECRGSTPPADVDTNARLRGQIRNSAQLVSFAMFAIGAQDRTKPSCSLLRAFVNSVDPAAKNRMRRICMRLTWQMRALATLFVISLACGFARAQAQENRHVVSLSELSKDSA